jgi:hypothetical protein
MQRPFHLRVIVTLLCACAAFALLTLAPPAQSTELRFDPAHAKAPPAVASASIELLVKAVEAGNAVVRMQFADKRSKSPVVIQGGAGPTLLRDDGIAPDTRGGDGHYAAFVHLNAEQYSRVQQRRIELAARYRTLPVFGGHRELLRHDAFEPSRNSKLVPGIPNALDKFKGVPFVVDPARELMITSTLVVEDSQRTYDACSGNGTQMGAWTFGKLMTEIANQPITGIHPADLTEAWLNQWASDLTINGFTVFNRAVGVQRFLDSWPRLPDGKLDLALAPFRLLAIVNRQDLRGNTLYGSGDAGEARLVFGALNCGGIVTGPMTPQAMDFTVIFEYGIRKNSCFAVRDWAQQWRNLGTLVLGSAAYNTALQAITDQFTLRDANPAQLPNRSAINQVRTNEFALADMPVDIFWQLREGRLQSGGSSAGLLLHATLAQTPDRSLNNTITLRDFINTHTTDILAGTHSVPLQYPLRTPFRGGHVDVGAGFTFGHAGVVVPEAEHRFSLATCSGCHTRDTATGFLHIEPRDLGAESQLSDFLTGLNMPKTIDGVMRTFHDLQDRQQKLDATASMSCLKKIDFPLEEIFFEPLVPAFAH